MELNFRRILKKLIKKYVRRINRFYIRKIESSFIQTEITSTTTILRILKEAMIRKMNNKDLEDQNSIVKEKRTKLSQEDVVKLSNKKRPQRVRKSIQRIELELIS